MTEPSTVIYAAHRFRAPHLRVVSDNPLYAGIERVSQRAPVKSHRIATDNDDGPRTA